MKERVVAQIRGVLAERVVVSHDPFLDLRALSAYAGVSVRQLREYLVHPPMPRDTSAPVPPPLPHYRLGSRIVVRRSEFDRWMAAYRARPSEARALADRLRAQAP